MDTVFTTIWHTFYGFHFSTLEITKKCAIYSVKRLIKFQNFEKILRMKKTFFYVPVRCTYFIFKKLKLLGSCYCISVLTSKNNQKAHFFKTLFFSKKNAFWCHFTAELPKRFRKIRGQLLVIILIKGGGVRHPRLFEFREGYLLYHSHIA